MNATEYDERFWIRLQAASGLVFSVFLALHLSTTMAATGGEDAFNAFQGGARRFYQTAIFEILAVGLPLVTHVVASITRIVRRRRSGPRRRPPLRLRLHRYSGWFLLAAIGGHVAATRLAPLAYDVQVRFGDLNFTTVFFGVGFSIYYILLGSCGTYHLVNGLTIAARVFGLRLPPAVRRGPGFWVPVAAATAAVAIGVASFSGWFFEVGSGSWGSYAAWLADFYGQDAEAFAPGRRP